MYGETLLSGQNTGGETGSYAASETSDLPNGRPARASRSSNGGVDVNGSRKRKHIDTYNSYDEMSDEDSAQESGDQWDGGDDDEDDKDNGIDSADEDDMSVEDDDLLDDSPKSLIVKLKVGKSLNGEGKTAQRIPETKEATPTPKAEEIEAHPQPTPANTKPPTQELPKPEPMEIDSAPAPPAHPIAFELPEDEKTNLPHPGPPPSTIAPVHGHPLQVNGNGTTLSVSLPTLPPINRTRQSEDTSAQLPTQPQVETNGWS